jgi:hypothetical protein
MKKSFVLIAAIVAVVGFGAVAAVAKERIKVGTSVSLKFTTDLSGPRPDFFSGRVKAKKKGCEKARTVRLYDDRSISEVGSANSDDRGRYKIFSSDLRGAFVAYARKKQMTKDNGDKIVCRRAHSKPRLHLPPTP